MDARNPQNKVRDWSEYILDPPHHFEQKAMHVFDHQFYHNTLYHDFCMGLGLDTTSVLNVQQIPLLPVAAFRETRVLGKYVEDAELMFKSSGTTETVRSTHYVASAELYRKSILEGMQHFYDLKSLVFLGYVPGYADNPHSSLIWMIKQLIDQDSSGFSRFLALGEPLDVDEILQIYQSGKQVMIFGPAFGFLDLLKEKSCALPENTIILETGGMKTHRRQITRETLHQILAEGFALDGSRIHSEYGMTEMLSQGYAQGGSSYRTPPWLQITVRDPENPMSILPDGQEGLIGVTDLANVHSCSFILTQDVGVKVGTDAFNVNGRFRYSNLRGCNFLIEEE
ncbi:MAG: hypothetical protein WD266_07595 [Balneolales bacterium]